MDLLEAKITGVHCSRMRLSEKVLMISSMPIPFRSPQEIPMMGFVWLMGLIGCKNNDFPGGGFNAVITAFPVSFTIWPGISTFFRMKLYD